MLAITNSEVKGVPLSVGACPVMFGIWAWVEFVTAYIFIPSPKHTDNLFIFSSVYCVHCKNIQFENLAVWPIRTGRGDNVLPFFC
jgi:hypothetical protein